MSILPVFAESTYAQVTRLSLDLSEVALSDVFRSVEKNSEYVFFYSDEVRSELSHSVSASSNSETVEQIVI